MNLLTDEFFPIFAVKYENRNHQGRKSAAR